MPDEDIMERLNDIDEDEIVGQEVTIDDELDFEGLGEIDNDTVPSPLAPDSTAIAPPAPRAEADAEVKSDVKDESATKKSSKPKSSKPKATTKSVREIPARTGTSVTDTEELVVRAKILRIVADKIIIEPGANISFSQ